MSTNNDKQQEAVALFNQSSTKDRFDICLRMIDTFDENDRISLIDEINKRTVLLRVKSVHGQELPLTQQLLLTQSRSRNYIESKISPNLRSDANLLDDLLTVCRFWQVDKCTHSHYKGDDNIILSINQVHETCKEIYGTIANRYIISDVVTFFAEIKNENLSFPTDGDYFVDNDGKKHPLKNDATRRMVRKLAQEKRSTLT